MTLIAPVAPSVVFSPTPHPAPEPPIALLQLDGDSPLDAASSVYAEARRGRRVVAVVAGDDGAVSAVARRLDEIGLPAACPDEDGPAVFNAPVALLRGPRTSPRPATGPIRPLRVALAGCGVVGGGLLARLQADPRFELVGVLVRDPAKARDVELSRDLAVTDPAALLAREPDVVVDALSDASTGRALIRAALARGVHVVGAGKQAIGADLPGLLALAESSSVSLRYSACVGGGAPMIETVRRAAVEGRVVRIEGVLNGTCNFILGRLAGGEDFASALTAARAAGFAEEDPSADLTGLDAAAKLSILAHEAGGLLPLSAVARTTLGGSLEPGAWRQVARWDRRTGEASVALEPVGPTSPFAALTDAWNGLRVELEDGRVIFTRGLGAGRTPTTESVWADLLELTDPA